GSTIVIALVCLVRRHGFRTRRRTRSEQNGRPHWLSLANIEGGRIPVFHRGVSMMLLLCLR
ncbi:unnamed protein product, partial [Hymenolepis diminuta]